MQVLLLAEADCAGKLRTGALDITFFFKISKIMLIIGWNSQQIKIFHKGNNKYA